MGRELFQVIRERTFGGLTSAEKNVVKLMNDLKVLEPTYPNNPYDVSGWESKKEVYNTLMEAVQTINSKTIKPKGVLYAQAINGKIIVGFALCNYNYFDWNKENKAVLKEIAKGRAMTWGALALEDVKIPQSIYMDLFYFINRANAYFKQEKLVDWARDFAGVTGEQPESLVEDNVDTNKTYNYAAIEDNTVRLVNDVFKAMFGDLFDVNVKKEPVQKEEIFVWFPVTDSITDKEDENIAQEQGC